MNKTITLLIFCFLSLQGIAQGTHNQAKVDVFGNPFNSSNQMMIRALNQFDKFGAEKEYFIFPQWSSMEVYGKDGQYMKSDSANVLITENKILFYKEGELLQIFGSTAEKVIIENRVFKPFYKNPKVKVFQFFEVVVDQEFKLLKEWEVETKAVSNNPMGIADDSPPKVVKSTKLYYINTKGDLVLVPRKKKEFIEIFSKSRRKMLELAKSEKRSIRNDDNVAFFFRYYNKLLNEKE